MAKSNGAPVIWMSSPWLTDRGMMPASFTKLTVCVPRLAFGGRAPASTYSSNLRGFALEAGRRDVGEIVRDHVHRAIGRELLRKTNEK